MDPKAEAHAEEAILALGRGDSGMARTSIAQAHEVDHKLAPLADVVYLACSEIDDEDRVGARTWDALADAVSSGSLLAVIEGCRNG